MNLITKRYPVDGGGEMVSAWVLNSRNNEPMSNVNMSIVSASGEVTTQCKSDAMGHCAFAVPADDLNNNIFAMYAEKTAADGNPELAYLVLIPFLLIWVSMMHLEPLVQTKSIGLLPTPIVVLIVLETLYNCLVWFVVQTTLRPKLDCLSI